MTAPNDPALPGDHPTPDQLADLLAGELADDDARATAAHCDACAQCGPLRAQLAGLPLLLASVPAPPMPDAVSRRLQAALQEESRLRAEPSADSTQAAVIPLRSRQRRWFAGVAAAAAAVVAVSVGTDALTTGGGEQSAGDAGSAGGGLASADQQRTQPESDSSGGVVPGPVPELTARLFAREAPVLVGKNRMPTPTVPPACNDAALREAGVQGRLGLTVRLDGQLARLAVDPESDVVRAHACSSGEALASAAVAPR
jgi:hypothetical protein